MNDTDPHSDDICVVCGQEAEPEGPTMHPIVSIPNGCVCGGCIQWLPTGQENLGHTEWETGEVDCPHCGETFINR